MASHTLVDSRVQERRLRPIYDWLDSGNNKKALQEAEKVLKKQPNFLCAKVLKALALQRLGKEGECEEILKNVCSQVPTDEATLQAITICYRAIHKPNKICDVYSAASKKDPKNEELLTHLFMSYVRVGDYRKQHQHAMSLYKLRPKNPYYFWAVMSVVMQAKNDKNMEKTVALKLAEKMVSKFVSEGKIEAEQEVQLYLMILEMQGKYEEALDVIEGELGEKLKSLITTAVKRIELLIKLERWKEANVLIKCQLEKNPDNWSDYKNYINSMLKLYCEYKELLGSSEIYDNRVPIRVPVQDKKGECIMWYEANYTPEMVKIFFKQLIKSVEDNNKKIRGPYLALLELYKVLHNESLDAEAIVGNITDLLVDYFNKFGEKPICVSDLKPYVLLLNRDLSSVFLSRINNIVGVKDDLPASTLSSLQKHISLLQLSRILGLHCQLSLEERLKLCNSIIGHYEASKKLVNSDKLPTDFVCNDPYIILLSHVLYSLYQDTGYRIHIIRAIYHLENALAASPSNFHFKLLLVKFYLLLGAGQQAFHFYDHLETKYIQLDSMGYLVATSGYGLGNFSATVALYDTTLKFFFSNSNDSVDHLTYAYKYGSFTKIQEFIEFRDRLNDSLHYTFCTVEKMLHDLLWTADYAQSEVVMRSMDIKPGANKISWANLRDNRDLSVIVSYESPSRQLNEKTIIKTFENLKNYVKLRDAIINSLIAVFYFINNIQNEQNNDSIKNCDIESSKSIVIQLLGEMSSFYSELKSQNLDVDVQDTITTPPPCRLKSFLKLPVCQIISDLINIILLLDPSQEDEKKLSQYIDSVSQNIRFTTSSLVSRTNKETVQNKEILEELVGITEMFAICAILCGNLNSYLKRLRKNVKKGKQKKEDEGSNDLLTYKNILKDLTECIHDLNEALSEFSGLNSVNVIASEVEALSMNESVSDFSIVEKKLYDSYSASIQEISSSILLRFCDSNQVTMFTNKLNQSLLQTNKMESIGFMCFCRTVLQTFNDLYIHKRNCEYIKKISLTNTKSDKIVFKTLPKSWPLENEVRNGPEVKLKFLKSWNVFLENEKELKNSRTKSATDFEDGKLSRRTKVPFLSRAVPLSNDHSYERCPCGAVFVTLLGKRQHQARFCKIVKNKKTSGNEIVTRALKSHTTSGTADLKQKSINYKGVLTTKQLGSALKIQGIKMLGKEVFRSPSLYNNITKFNISCYPANVLTE